MDIDEDFVRGVMADMEARVAEIKMIGGIARRDAPPFGNVAVPIGWRLDAATEYYVPPSWAWNPEQAVN